MNRLTFLTDEEKLLLDNILVSAAIDFEEQSNDQYSSDQLRNQAANQMSTLRSILNKIHTDGAGHD
ncbi:hypothetical protein [Pseudoalteromonas ruthenica]|uniref:hypothetical protein n=1 Tax=Pseudoalteromonas ruthenica TaxID=151081 RepID=UPI00241C11B3|nr:hypothetical protein [Pseudoalteromonas ruthenica]|tara:strand:+ start:10970 stop:11167 length:198 start_codon:yes stop_codon:yes gene_type:complete